MRRVAALDWMRGIVMVLMAIDHASGTFNSGRLVSDAFFMYEPGSGLPAAQFLTRWITHLCAPSFLFLAGASLAMSVERRSRAGGSVDGHIAIRGILLIALDATWMAFGFQFGWNRLMLGVLYAIGASLLFMIPLRRLATGWLLVGALAMVAGNEALFRLLEGGTDVTAALFISGGRPTSWLLVTYPMLHWLAVLMLGWAFGRHLVGGGRPEPVLWLGGLAALVVFAVIRGIDGYGNMLLHRDDASLLQWLHVAKYPPSAAFFGLELGLMALVLAALFRLERRVPAPPTWSLVLGQAALFFYLLHIHVLQVAAHALGMVGAGGLVESYVAAAAVIALLFPLCWWYRRYKLRHPNSLARFI